MEIDREPNLEAISYDDRLIELRDKFDTLIEFNEFNKEKVYSKLELDEHSGITKLTKAIKRLEVIIRGN